MSAGPFYSYTAEVQAALTELLRLYDWRNELGRIERDFNHDKKQMTRWLNQYGREKHAAWAVAREVLRGGETAIRGSQSSQPRLEGETPSPATLNAAPQAAVTPATAYLPESDPVAEVSGKPAVAAPELRQCGPSQPVTADQLGKWLAFWTHYSSLNEGAQDAENDQRHLTLDDMSEAWLRLTDGTDATGERS